MEGEGCLLKKKKNRTKNKRFLLAVLFLVVPLIITGYLGYTYASMTDYDEKKNFFRVGNLEAKIVEEFKPPTIFEKDIRYTKNVTVVNEGEQKAFIRVMSMPMITTKDNDTGDTIVLNSGPKALAINYNFNDWVDGQDGYYYYKKILNIGEKSKELFSTVQLLENYLNTQLTVEVKVEAINTTKYAYRDAWWGSENPPTNNVLKNIDMILSSQL